MANCAIVGINWGDEGKGRMVDYLTGQYDVVVRYQGGGNAGHTVINDMGKFALHLLPSGVFRPGVMNILGNGVALDCENLVTEMETIRAAGVSISPKNLMVSHRASLLLPWHRELDALEEARPITHEASTETARMDGNGVNLTEQGVELARNTYQIQYAMNAVNSDLSILRTAIKGT